MGPRVNLKRPALRFDVIPANSEGLKKKKLKIIKNRRGREPWHVVSMGVRVSISTILGTKHTSRIGMLNRNQAVPQ